jgi:hypothetical protein
VSDLRQNENTTKQLAAFAKKSGVRIVSCDPEWGGRFAYTESRYPKCTVAGFRNENAAYRHWLESTFGPATSKAVLDLMRRAA